MSRPQTLAEVAQIARAGASDFAMALDEFMDEFYLDHPDKAVQQRRLDPIPELVGDLLPAGVEGPDGVVGHPLILFDSEGGIALAIGPAAMSASDSRTCCSRRSAAPRS